MRFIIAITGASGAIYGTKLIELLAQEHEIHLILSKGAKEIIKYETNTALNTLKSTVFKYYENDNLHAELASGTFSHDGMVIIPASMKTIAAITHGYASNLITRAADCTLKENRKLIVVPRETPLNLIHLRNLTILKEAGAIIMPASPAFWHRPQSIDSLVEAFVQRVAEKLGVKIPDMIRWKGE